MNEILSENTLNFNFNKQDIRVILVDNEPWFIAKDVATTLGYIRKRDGKADVNAMTRKIPNEDKDTTNIRTLGGVQKMAILNESGLYISIFGSSKEEAYKFKLWVTREVLPSIRKTGSYNLTEKPKEKSRDNLISVSQSELDKELQTLDFLLNRVHFSEKEKIEFINKTLEKINFQTLENPHLLKHEPVFTLTQLLKDFGVDMRTADFNRKLESFGIIERFGNGSKVSNSSSWILLDIGENRYFKEGTNHRYYKSTFGELLDLVL